MDIGNWVVALRTKGGWLILYVQCLRVLQIKGCMLVEMCGKQLVILVWGSEE